MKDTKQQWFKEAKYGLFIHFGLFSILGGEWKGKSVKGIAEWIMNYMDIPREEYRELATQMNPINFDAEEIVKSAKKWGMKYVVFTAKHHEGYALYNSRCCDYNITNSCGRDLLKELQLACEKYDMRLGVYYSQAQDWDDPNGFVHMKDNSKKVYRKYLDGKCLPQIREIMSGYGKISLMWFDTPMGTSLAESKEMIELVKSIQPDCIISGRVGNCLGDYMTTGDNFIPAVPFAGDWEVPATINGTWGFHKKDENWKSPQEILKLLLKINSRGGNYLLNIGPDGMGNIPVRSIEVLEWIGKYIRENAEAIYATERVEGYPYELEWGQLTCKKHRLYVHIFQKMYAFQLLNVANKIKGAYVVKDGRKLELDTSLCCEGDKSVIVFLPEDLANEEYYCIGLELEEEKPMFDQIRDQ